MVRTKNATMLQELLDAKLVVIEDSGHMLNLESPERYGYHHYLRVPRMRETVLTGSHED
jgi:pimeloyl-ACP methyl ester carboxylesterase